MSSHSALIPDGAPLLLLVAHPDDEIIGVGAQLASWRKRVICVHATTGAPIDGRDATRAGFARLRDYASARRREAERALALAGISAGRLLQLPFDDQSLAQRLDDLVTEITSLVRLVQPAAVLTHPFEGGHPDHDALSLAVSVALGASFDAGAPPARLEFACYHEGKDGQLVTNRFAPPYSGDEACIALDDAARARKQELMACFGTQQQVLASFDTREEWLRTAPAYDYRRAPNGGRVWYDRFDWGIDSAAWLRRAAACLDSAGVEAGC